jgi:hypothetical protein
MKLLRTLHTLYLLGRWWLAFWLIVEVFEEQITGVLYYIGEKAEERGWDG